MTPALPEMVPSARNGERVGRPKFAWLNKFKNSLRNASVCPSCGRNVFTMDMFTLTRFGPISVLRPRLPYVPTGGNSNAVGSYQRSTLPMIGLFDAPARRFGRSGKSEFPSFDRLNPSCALHGVPECADTIILVSQPRARIPAAPVSESPGRRYVAFTATMWRTWKDDRPRSAFASHGTTEISLVFCVCAAPHAVAEEIALEYV